MKVLFLSNLYPNSKEPARATFNRQKIAHLKDYCEITVVAPVQSHPFKSYIEKRIKHIPPKEVIDGLDVYHPRVLYIPKLFRLSYGILYYFGVRKLISRLHKINKFDVVFSSWLYPDGYAAMALAGKLKIPFIVEALGSDINIYLKTFIRKLMITQTLKKADYILTASEHLKNKICSLGIPGNKISTIHIGVDRNLFFPVKQELARNNLGIKADEKLILFIGSLVRLKGLQYLVKALKQHEKHKWKLFIVGEGSLYGTLKRMIDNFSMNDRVVFVGPCLHENIPLWINASDLLCLPSLCEGIPNVILEAFACGIPVVASRVGGVSEIVVNERLGELIEPKNIKALERGIEKVFDKEWERTYISEYTGKFSWNAAAKLIFKHIEICSAKSRG
ncbi:MAG: glycosyltransferase [Candidatus Omnitrophica bacterium]|nr:glycosyltransferase [Candidatus Omnitrophota bacterium]